MARLHHEVDTLLREVITAVDTARRNGIGGHQIRADILSCARRLLEALRTASDESGAAIDEGYVRFASEFHAYVMQGFPRILTLGFERFDIAARYELGLQNPDLEYTYQDAWAAASLSLSYSWIRGVTFAAISARMFQFVRLVAFLLNGHHLK